MDGLAKEPNSQARVRQNTRQSRRILEVIGFTCPQCGYGPGFDRCWSGIRFQAGEFLPVTFATDALRAGRTLALGLLNVTINGTVRHKGLAVRDQPSVSVLGIPLPAPQGRRGLAVPRGTE